MGHARGLGLTVRNRRKPKYLTCVILLPLLLVTAKSRSADFTPEEERLQEKNCLKDGSINPTFIFCNWPGDWSCRSELFTVLAKKLSTKASSFVFSVDCMVFDVHPRIFFVGGLTDVEQAQKHPFYASSDLRVLLNFEPGAIPESIMISSASIFDVVFTSQIQVGFDQAGPILLTWPYASFAMSQSSSLNLGQLEARISPAVLPSMFGAYATRHCRAAHRTKFYNMLADKLEPLYHLSQRCGEHDRYPKDLGIMLDRGDELHFMRNIISRYAQFKFVVVFENELIDTYVTEKLLLARLSGAIPVYFGGKIARVMFNPLAFIDCSPDSMVNLDSAFERCILELQSVNQNDSKWKAMYEAPFLNKYDHDVAMELVSITLLMYVESTMKRQSTEVPNLRAENLKNWCSKLHGQLWLNVPSRLSERCVSS